MAIFTVNINVIKTKMKEKFNNVAEINIRGKIPALVL